MLKKKQTIWMLGAACLIVLIIAGFSTIGYGKGNGGFKFPFFAMQPTEEETAPSDDSTEEQQNPDSSKETAEGHEESGRTQGSEKIDTVIIELPTETTEPTEPETTEPETTTEPEPVGPSIYDGYLFADVKLYLNIRKEPNVEAEVLGKLYVGDIATILEAGEEWTYITSGSVTGYVSNEYTVTSHAAEKYVIEEGLYVATVTTSNGLRIRAEANTESEIFGSAYKGQTFSAISEENGWVKIKHSTASSPQEVAYLSADYVELEYNFGKAISIEEEKEQIRLAKEAAEKAAREAFIKKVLANSQVINTANREPFSFTDEDIYLLACLVYEEAGGEPYEGKLAVANVVLNRYLAGYGDTLTEIIYAKNQFSTAQSGVLDKRLEKGPSDSCVRAAKEAVAGVNNIGDYCHFITTEKANYGLYYEYTVLHNHCFYKRVWK